jgi:two-component system, response regulator
VRTGHILLIEDNADDVALTIRALNRNNIANDVRVAHDGREALELLFGDHRTDERPPALILLDLKLPKVDGFEVLRRIRTDERIRFVPIVVLTSSNREEDVLGSYSVGANAYVRKPVKFAEFAEAVRTLGMFWLLLNELPPEVSAAPPVQAAPRESVAS